MRTSRKILSIVGGIFLIYFVTAMIVVRNDIRTLLEKEGQDQSFINVPVEPFEKIVFSTNWDAQVKYGLRHKIEIQTDPNRTWTYTVRNDQEFLRFEIDSTFDSNTKIKARITTPYVDFIQVDGNSEIEFSNFTGDSLWIVMNDNSIVTGRESKFVFLSQVTSGNAQFNLIDDPTK